MESRYDPDSLPEQEPRDAPSKGVPPADLELSPEAGVSDFGSLINRNEYYELMRAALAQAEQEGVGEGRANSGAEVTAGAAAVDTMGQPYLRFSSLCALGVIFVLLKVVSVLFGHQSMSGAAARQEIQNRYGSDARLIRVTEFFFLGNPISSGSADLNTSVEELNQMFDYRAQSADKTPDLDPRGFTFTDGVTTYQPPIEGGEEAL